jgi:RimJ/RimL family protein N-acetyltransferase
MALEGKRVILRGFVDDDISTIVSWNDDPSICEGLGDTGVYSASMLEDQVADKIREDDEHNLFLGIELAETGELIGQVSLQNIDWRNRSGSTGVLVDPEHQGEGIGTEALSLVLRYAFEVLNLHRVELHEGVLEFNQAAVRVYEKCGFKVEGRSREAFFYKGRYWDKLHMAVLASEFAGAQR